MFGRRAILFVLDSEFGDGIPDVPRSEGGVGQAQLQRHEIGIVRESLARVSLLWILSVA